VIIDISPGVLPPRHDNVEETPPLLLLAPKTRRHGRRRAAAAVVPVGGGMRIMPGEMITKLPRTPRLALLRGLGVSLLLLLLCHTKKTQ